MKSKNLNTTSLKRFKSRLYVAENGVVGINPESIGISAANGLTFKVDLPPQHGRIENGGMLHFISYESKRVLLTFHLLYLITIKYKIPYNLNVISG